MLGDFNDDLRQFGVEGLRAALRLQLHPQDVSRFMTPEAETSGEGAGLVPDPGEGPPAGEPRPRACEGAI
jgi:hypothetical protein